MHLVGFIIRIYDDARSPGLQKIKSYCIVCLGGFGMSVCNWAQTGTHIGTADAPVYSMTVTESIFMTLTVAQQPEQNFMKIRRKVWSLLLGNRQ